MTIVHVGLVGGVVTTVCWVRYLLRNHEPRPRWNLLPLAIILAVLAYMVAATLVGPIETGYFHGRRSSLITRGRDPFLYWTLVLVAYTATVGLLSTSISLVVRMFRKGAGPEELV